MDCLFCRIARKDIPAKIVYSDDDVLAFLDINPANPGHILVVPKRHSGMIMDSDDESLKKLILVVRELSRKVMNELKADGVNVVQNNGKAAGQLVHHTHFHIIPRFPDDMVVITYKRAKIPDEKMDEIKKKLETAPIVFKEPEVKEERRLPKANPISPEKWVDM